MDIKEMLLKVTAPIQKYKYVLLILIIGLVLMMLPSQTKNTDSDAQSLLQETTIPLNEQIAALLSKVEGAGRVEVMLSIETGEEILYQADEDINTTEQSSATRKETVVITDSERSETGLIRQTNPPNYLGAIVVCDGADSPTVRLALCEAVSKITGLGSDRIAILKMK